MTINDPIPEGALLIDLRDAEDYHAGHLPGAVNASLPGIMEAAPDKRQMILLYCYRGMRGLRAALTLKAQGYTNVQNLGGVNKYRGKLTI